MCSRFLKRFVLGMSCLLAHAVAMPAEPAMNAPAPLLLITGASYAAEWKEPVLPGYRTVNRAVGGQETSAVLARFRDDLAATRPAVVLIWGHVNNIFRAPDGGVDAARRRADSDIRAMVAEARAQNIRVILATEVTMGPPTKWSDRFSTFVNEIRGKETYRGWVNRNVRDVNTAIRTHASEAGLPVFDFERALDGGEGYRREEYTREDGSHLTPAAYAELTRYTAQQLSKMRN
jgi:lysophospholipase L1-like esterase